MSAFGYINKKFKRIGRRNAKLVRKFPRRNKKMMKRAKRSTQIKSNGTVAVIPFNRGVFPNAFMLRLPFSAATFINFATQGVNNAYFDVAINNPSFLIGTSAGQKDIGTLPWTNTSTVGAVATSKWMGYNQIALPANPLYFNYVVHACKVEYGVDIVGAGTVEIVCQPYQGDLTISTKTPQTNVDAIKNQPYSKYRRVDAASGTMREHNLKGFWRIRDLASLTKDQWHNQCRLLDTVDVGATGTQSGPYAGSAVTLPRNLYFSRFACHSLDNTNVNSNMVVQISGEVYVEFFNPNYTNNLST